MFIECGILTCLHNEPFNKGYGYCRCDKNPVLKFRIAADLGKGTMILMECLNMVMPEEGEEVA